MRFGSQAIDDIYHTEMLHPHTVLPFPGRHNVTPPRPKADDDDAVHVGGLDRSDAAMLKLVAAEATRKKFEEMLITLGIDAGKPGEMQKDMIHLRASRERKEKGWWHLTTQLITLATGLFVGWLVTGFKTTRLP